MQASSLPHLSIQDVACRRGDRLLFRGLSHELSAGEALHVTGANGTGKSSLLRIMAGLLRPYAGAIEPDGTIGLVDDRLALDPALQLGRALGFWFGVDLSSSDAASIMATMRLKELAEVPVRYLSTGQRKRAALARLIGQRAAIWLLDEPLSGLDAVSQAIVDELISEHCANGGIAVIASHQPLKMDGLKMLPLESFAPQPEQTQ
ncbi:MAG: heme ABC exporter ATP-binding protein CcmA [Pseudomonadota bacterium]